MSAPDDDELLVDPRRLPVWATVLIGLAVAALLALLLTRDDDSGTVSSPDRSGQPTQTPTVRFPTPSHAPVIDPDGTGEPVVDAVLDHGHLTVLRTDSLLDMTPTGKVRVNRHVTGDDALGAEAPSVRLFLDRARDVGWAVSILERRARVMTFDPTTMQPRVVLDNEFIVYDAALFDGRIYAATREGIAWVAPSGASGHVPNVSGIVTSIAADPARHRLLAVLGEADTPIIAVTPAGNVTTVAELAASKAQVRVVAGRIWIAGFARGGAVVQMLDPKTLRPLLRVRDAKQLGPGAVIVGVGANDLFVASGSGLEITWCIDARSGERADEFRISPFAITSTTGRTIALVGRRLEPLDPNPGCVG